MLNDLSFDLGKPQNTPEGRLFLSFSERLTLLSAKVPPSQVLWLGARSWFQHGRVPVLVVRV